MSSTANADLALLRAERVRSSQELSNLKSVFSKLEKESAATLKQSTENWASKLEAAQEAHMKELRNSQSSAQVEKMLRGRVDSLEQRLMDEQVPPVFMNTLLSRSVISPESLFF